MTSDDSWDVHQSELKCDFNLFLVPQGGLLATEKTHLDESPICRTRVTCWVRLEKNGTFYIFSREKNITRPPAVSVEGFAGGRSEKPEHVASWPVIPLQMNLEIPQNPIK